MDTFPMIPETVSPSNHPWMFTIPSDLSWSSNSVVTFTGKPIENVRSHQFKRKGHHLDSATLPSKLYISEEKMIARMKELNINEFAPSDEIELEETLPVLVLSQELKNMSTSEPILPPTIIEKLQKPSMELVLWKPPEGIVGNLINAVKSRKNFTSKKDSNIMDDETNKIMTSPNHAVTEDKMEL